MSTLQQINDATASLAVGVQKGIVRVMADERSIGAGTIWHADGLIVTNAHVVQHARVLQVGLPDGRVIPAQVIASSRERDIAALSVAAHDLPTLKPGESHTLQAGAWVMALGHPWGVLNAATSGIVIGVGRDFPEMPDLADDWVVASLHLRPGHSGGPLVDVNGHLVGMNTLITGPDVGVAVAVDTVKDFLRRAIGSRTPAHIV